MNPETIGLLVRVLVSSSDSAPARIAAGWLDRSRLDLPPARRVSDSRMLEAACLAAPVASPSINAVDSVPSHGSKLASDAEIVADASFVRWPMDLG